MIEKIIILGSIIDLFLTYKYLSAFRVKFPKKDYVVIESNPLIRAFVRSNGIGHGVIMAGFIIIGILMILLYFLNTNFKYFLAGVYYMMITFHLTNFLALRRLEQK